MKRITLCVTNDLSGDQRLHRICTTLHEAGYSVRLIGRRLPDSRALRPRLYQLVRFSLPFHRGKMFYLSYNVRLAWELIARPGDVIVANDLDTLLGCYLASKLRNRPLVYDSHEYFTEVPELIGRKWSRAVWLKLERLLLPKIQYAYTVNGSLAKIYRDSYDLNMQVVRNLPFSREPAPHQKREKVILYQGSVNLGRGLETAIEAMAFLPGYHLWIVGKGDVLEQLQQRVVHLRLEQQVTFWGFKPPEELWELTPQAALGLSIEEDLGGNYHYASPNKVFDYIQAHVPVLVSDLPEMRATIEEYKV
ncbi:MAG: glycosyltransferase, partial [Bacteroidota bacterium]